MNREIKFRGKIKYNGNHRFSGEWVYGYYWYSEIEEKHYIKESEDIDGLGTFEHTDFEVDPETVGQFTGLKDSTIWSDLTKEEKDNWQENNGINSWKGREIYEGDIVKTSFYNHDSPKSKFIQVVEFEKGTFVAKSKDVEVESLLRTNCPLHMLSEPDVIKIIGNNKDNPELLK